MSLITKINDPNIVSGSRATQAFLQWLNSAGQILFDEQNSGATANRPTENLYVGQTYFDTTLNQKIFWSGSAWVTWTAASSGLLGINNQAGNYTIALSDNHGIVRLTGSGQTVTVPTTLGPGFICNVSNVGASATISPSGTLYFPGTGTGARTLAAPGICTLICDAAGEWFITGAGLT